MMFQARLISTIIQSAGIVAAATTTGAASSPETVLPLLESELLQLTDNFISALFASDNPVFEQLAPIFSFANATSLTTAAQEPRASNSTKCKTYPGDFLWPSEQTWNIFDLLLGGALEPYAPIASVCYPNSTYNDYDAAKCEYITDNWVLPSVHYDDPGSSMNPLYTGMTCAQGTNISALGTCTEGGYSLYYVNVTNVAQIQLAVNFARSLDLRLVIRNTGHDYNGRSMGYGALSIWTHALKDIKYVENYTSTDYSGPVFHVGAGVQGFELYQAAEKYGVSAVAGICPSVGIFGGYSTGGGHSPLMQLFGMGADQILAMQVVTASGHFETVSPSINSDLYWAMLGGGGGTFGIVTSAVVKVHPKLPVVTSVFNFTTTSSVSNDTFWEAVRFLWDEFPTYNDAKTYSYFSIMSLGGGAYTFSMLPFWAPNMTVVQYEALVQPLIDKLEQLQIPYQIETKYYESVYPAYNSTFGTIDFHIGGTSATPGNRLIPKENWNNETIRDKTFSAIQNAVDNALLINIYHQAPANPDDYATRNSVNPAFRNEASQLVAVNLILDSSAAGIKAGNEFLTNTIMGPLREVTPNGGAYGNEADISEPDWQQAFWGDNYDRLSELKIKWDPADLFYVHHGVGSERWVVDDGGIVGVQSQAGKLCRV